MESGKKACVLLSFVFFMAKTFQRSLTENPKLRSQGDVLIKQNTGHSSNRITQNPEPSGSGSEAAVCRASRMGRGRGRRRSPRPEIPIARCSRWRLCWVVQGRSAHAGRCPACLCAVLGVCTG
jgi:hypothetical protein